MTAKPRDINQLNAKELQLGINNIFIAFKRHILISKVMWTPEALSPIRHSI